MAKKVYVASRVSRAEMWRTLRDRDGVNIVSSWIDEAGVGQTASFEELWGRIRREIESCDYFILYAPNEDAAWKGALIETGIAIALEKRVFVVAPGPLEGTTLRPLGSWLMWGSRVRVVDSLAQALARMPDAYPAIPVPQAVVLRRMLFWARLGHPEHHPSHNCDACTKLREEIETKIKDE